MLVVKGVMERAENQRQSRGGGFRLIQMNVFRVYTVHENQQKNM